MTLPLGAVQLAVVSFIVGPMAVVAVALRLWSRYLQRRNLAANDYMALVALVLAESALSVFLAGRFVEYLAPSNWRDNILNSHFTQSSWLCSWLRNSSRRACSNGASKVRFAHEGGLMGISQSSTLHSRLIVFHHLFSFSCLPNYCGPWQTRVSRHQYCISTWTSFLIRPFAACAMVPYSSLLRISPWYWSKPLRFANLCNTTGINQLKGIAPVKALLTSLQELSISLSTLSLWYYRCLWFSTCNWFYPKKLPSLQCSALGLCKCPSSHFLCLLLLMYVFLSSRNRLLTTFMLARICVVSLLRVIWLWNWNLADLTYTVTPGAIYSVLEPTPGVVNACLPTIKPAITELFGAYVLIPCKAFPISILETLD